MGDYIRVKEATVTAAEKVAAVTAAEARVAAEKVAAEKVVATVEFGTPRRRGGGRFPALRRGTSN